jgi:hypothetical protein
MAYRTKLETCRKERGWTRAQLAYFATVAADELGFSFAPITTTNVRYWEENPESIPRTDRGIAIAHVLHIDPINLWGG